MLPIPFAPPSWPVLPGRHYHSDVSLDNGAHERRAGDAHARQVVGGGPAVGDRPAHHERLGELVAQEAEAGHLHGVAVAVRLDVEDLDLEDVTVLGPVDVDGPGARV